VSGRRSFLAWALGTTDERIVEALRRLGLEAPLRRLVGLLSRGLDKLSRRV